MMALRGEHYLNMRPHYKRRSSARAIAHRGSVVYVWMAPDGRADWVGRGTLHRAGSHGRPASRSRRWWTSRHILLILTCDSEWQAMEYEGKWGAFYQPRQNREGYRHNAGA